MSCLFDTVASLWVTTWEYLFAKPEILKHVQEAVCKSKITRDLHETDDRLCQMERQLVAQIKAATLEAISRKKVSDVNGAKRKIMDKRRLEQQLDRLRASQAVVVMHMDALQNNALNQELASTLRKSTEAMKQLAPGLNITQIEDNMFDLEEGMKRAREVGDLLGRPITSDIMQPMDSDVEDELDELINATDEQCKSAVLDINIAQEKLSSRATSRVSTGSIHGSLVAMQS